MTDIPKIEGNNFGWWKGLDGDAHMICPTAECGTGFYISQNISADGTTPEPVTCPMFELNHCLKDHVRLLGWEAKA